MAKVNFFQFYLFMGPFLESVVYMRKGWGEGSDVQAVLSLSISLMSATVLSNIAHWLEVLIYFSLFSPLLEKKK